MLASQFVEARVRARKETRRIISGFMMPELCAGWCAQLSGVQSVMGVLCSPGDRRVPQEYLLWSFPGNSRGYICTNCKFQSAHKQALTDKKYLQAIAIDPRHRVYLEI